MSNSDVRKILGRRVKMLRKARKLSQEQLAELIGKSVDTVSNIERGLSPPRIETASDIARALGVEVFELLREESKGLSVDALPAELQDLVHLLRDQSPPVRQAVLENARTAVTLATKVGGRKG